jgi:hypothetical protein
MICKTCNIDKLPECFEKHRQTCRLCRNNYRKTLKTRQGDGLRNYILKRTYGITLEDFKRMSEEQNHLCFICNRPGTNRWNNKLAVDHCHVTGKIRKLLCDKCNKGLGQFDDNPELLLLAANYIKLFKV